MVYFFYFTQVVKKEDEQKYLNEQKERVYSKNNPEIHFSAAKSMVIYQATALDCTCKWGFKCLLFDKPECLD